MTDGRFSLHDALLATHGLGLDEQLCFSLIQMTPRDTHSRVQPVSSLLSSDAGTGCVWDCAVR